MARVRRALIGGTVMAGLLACGSPLAFAATDLRQGFASPPPEARPRVWWHWMNGNITKEGIGKDLDWFTKIGVGGFTAFDGAGAVPRFVDKPLTYMSPDWKDAFGFAIRKADALGLEASIAASPGWSQTGGPWVKPEDAMKKYVWTETTVAGGKRVSIALPRPSDQPGGFQDAGGEGRAAVPVEPFYRDARVFAYRSSAPAPKPRISVSALVDEKGVVQPNGLTGELAARLTDGSLREPIYLPQAVGEVMPSITLTYDAPVAASALTIASGDPFQPGYRPELGPIAKIEASDDGRNFRTLAEGVYLDTQRTYAFARTTARVFRVTFRQGRPPFGGYYRGANSATKPGVVKTAPQPAPPPPAARRTVAIAEIGLRQAATVNEYEVKAGFGIVNDFYAIATPAGVGDGLAAKDVIDLTGRMKADGTLDWDAPKGQWTVVRFGYGLTGKENGPASAEATGLEVDKLSADRVRGYMDQYLGMYASATGKDLIGRRGLTHIMNDSYEARFQNWTEDMLDQFRKRRGYDAAPWLPVLTGQVVESAERSDRFLWDWRRTISDLIAQAHYKTIADEAHKIGMKHYAESLEDNRAYAFDDMESRKYADIPMAASGVGGGLPAEGVLPPRRRLVDNHGAASVAHVYGKPIAAAEAFTAALNGAMPQQLKTIADMFFVEGVNRLFIHTSAHQPGDQGPGVTLNGIGHFFTRNETWADVAKPWVDYIARSSFLLQQGAYVADLAYFYGEEAPITGIWGGDPQTPLPNGYGYDFVNSDVVLNLFSVKDGKLTTPSGMRYSVLWLGGRSSYMTLPVAKKLLALVKDGATIAGDRPIGSPSLADDDREWARVADELWGDGRDGIRAIGKGRVMIGYKEPGDALITAGVQRDFEPAGEYKEEPLAFIHRRTEDADIYFVSNQGAADYTNNVTFRTAGRAVEFWDPATGESRPASYSTVDGRTVVPMELNRAGSTFLILRGEGAAPARVVPQPTLRVVTGVTAPWSVSFQKDRGAPAAPIAMPFLRPLNDSEVPGVRYFSGTAAYDSVLTVPAGAAPKGGWWLDLGEVRDIAKVIVNGQEAGIVWRAPFRVDVSKMLKPGRNTIRIEVTNSWKNRMIGDQQPGMVQVSFAPSSTDRADTPLMKAGLIGPVSLVAAEF